MEKDFLSRRGRAKTFLAKKNGLGGSLTFKDGVVDFMKETPASHVDRFRNEYEKIKRSLLYSLDRERTYINQIKDLKAELSKVHSQLQTRGALVEGLEKRVKDLEAERQRAVRAEAFSKQREGEAKEIVRSLKEQMANLESRVQRASMVRVQSEKDLERERELDEEERKQRVKLSRRVKQIDSTDSPFDSWRKIHSVWTPKDSRKKKSEPIENNALRPRTAYAQFAASNAKPHAHEIALR